MKNLKSFFLLSLLGVILLLSLVNFIDASLSDGLTNYWSFDESGGNALNSIFNGNTGIIVGTTITRDTGVIGNSVHNNGSTDYINFGRFQSMFENTITLNSSQLNYTISFWIMINSSAILQTPYFCYVFDNVLNANRDIYWYKDDSNDMITGGGNQVSIGNKTIFNTFQYVDFIKNGTNFTVYINGTLVNSTTQNVVNIFNVGRVFKLFEGQNLNHLNGWIDEMSFYNRSINQNEINQLYNNGLGLSYQNITGSNYTFISEYYNPITYSGSNEIFNLSIQVNNGENLTSAFFYFNGTSYPAIIQYIPPTSGDFFTMGFGSGGTGGYILSKNFTIPKILTLTNVSFNWIMNFQGTGQINSSYHNIIINPIQIDDCSTFNNILLNITLRDEAEQFLINSSVTNSSNNGTIEVSLNLFSSDYVNIVGTYFKKFLINPAKICINASLLNNIYYLDAQIKYSASGYAPEYYNIQKYLLSNTTFNKNIILYELNSSFNTDFLITYKDKNYIPVQGALIIINRKYVSEGVFKISEIPITDIYGQAIAHLDRNGVIYSISVIKNGVLLLYLDNIVVSCQDNLIGKCELNLRENMDSTKLIEYINKDNLNFNIDFNVTSRRITLNFMTTDSSNVNMRMNVSKFDAYMNGTICNSNVIASLGSIICDIPPTYGNATFIINIYKNEIFVTREIRSIPNNPQSIFGNDGIILTVVLVLTLTLMFIPSYVGTIIGVVIGVIVSSALMIFNGGDVVSFVSPIIWLIVTGIILIWKISTKKNGSGLS